MKITLCGSMRFADLFHDWNGKLSKAGHAVYAPAMSPSLVTVEQKEILDLVHLIKIEESDAIFVLDGKVDGASYIGDSTRREIAWARLKGKAVFWFSNGGGARLIGPLAAVHYGEAARQPDAGLASVPREVRAARADGIVEALAGRAQMDYAQDLAAERMVSSIVAGMAATAPITPNDTIQGKLREVAAINEAGDVQWPEASSTEAASTLAKNFGEVTLDGRPSLREVAAAGDVSSGE